MVAVHDTVMETKTITITKNEAGDTTFTSVVTDRERICDRAAIKDKEEKVIVRTDTVFVERRDSVEVSEVQDSSRASRASPFVRSLRWIVALVIAVIVLIVVIKIKW